MRTTRSEFMFAFRFGQRVPRQGRWVFGGRRWRGEVAGWFLVSGRREWAIGWNRMRDVLEQHGGLLDTHALHVCTCWMSFIDNFGINACPATCGPIHYPAITLILRRKRST